MKRIKARYYRTEAGNEPVKDWIKSLPKADMIIVGKDIGKVEFGWPIGMPVCRGLGKALWEVRSTIKDGKVEARTYFSIEGGTMLLLHGDDGKSGQDDAIKVARERLRLHNKRKKDEDDDDV